jgi:hypothetical protein
LKYFRLTGTIAGIPVDVSRTGYTGDLGYEIWMPWDRAIEVWDRLVEVGHAFDARPAGMLALDVARIEAGLLLIDVDFHGSKKVPIDAQRYSPYEMNLGRLVAEKKGPFVGREALSAERARGPRRQIVGLEIDWDDIERQFADVGLPPQVPTAASRSRARLSRRQPGEQGNFNHVVAGVEENARPRDDRRATFCHWHRARDRAHRRSCPSPRPRARRRDAVLQPRRRQGPLVHRSMHYGPWVIMDLSKEHSWTYGAQSTGFLVQDCSQEHDPGGPGHS